MNKGDAWTDAERAAFLAGFSIQVDAISIDLYVVEFPEGNFTSAADFDTARKWLNDAWEIEQEED